MISAWCGEISRCSGFVIRETGLLMTGLAFTVIELASLTTGIEREETKDCDQAQINKQKYKICLSV